MTDNSKQYDMPPAILRQRRNLLIVSILIVFLKIAGAEIESISLIGIKTSFKNPEAIFLFLQLFLGYFFYRYYLYIIQEPNLFIKDTFYFQLQKYTHLKLQAIKDEKFPNVKEYGGNYNFKDMEYVSTFIRNVTGVLEHDSRGVLVEGSFKVNILAFTLDGFRAMLFTLLNRSYVTDYIVPFAVAFIAFITGFNLIL